MHILLAILGIMGAAAFWWYRIKYMSEAAGEVADSVGRVRGKMRRDKLRKKAAVAPVAAIDDPVTAAATVMMAIAAEDVPVSDALEGSIRGILADIAPAEKVDEALVYAKWASDQVADVPTVIDRVSDFLAQRLDEAEKEQLVGWVASVTPKNERHPMFGFRVERLRKKLGLVVH